MFMVKSVTEYPSISEHIRMTKMKVDFRISPIDVSQKQYIIEVINALFLASAEKLIDCVNLNII